MDPGVRKGWEKENAALGMELEQGMREWEPGERTGAGRGLLWFPSNRTKLKQII